MSLQVITVKCRGSSSYLSQVGDQVQGDVSEGIVQVSADHVDPVAAVSGVAVRAVEAHHVGQVREGGRLLLRTHLRYLIRRLLTERCRTVKVLDQVREEAQDVQRETCRKSHS